MFLLKCLFQEQCRGGKFLSGLCRKNSLIETSSQDLSGMGALLESQRPEEVAKSKCFVLNWSEKDNCGKVTITYDEAKGK